MVDRDLLRVIARVTAKFIAEVSDVHYERHRDSSTFRKTGKEATDMENREPATL